MSQRAWISVCVVVLAMVGVVPWAAISEEQKSPVKCLMMGSGPHGEVVMPAVLDEIKKEYKTVAITLSENVDDLKYDNLKNYDVLIMVQIKVQDGNPPDFVKESLVQYLKEGHGLVVTHFAVANVQKWRDSIDIYGAMWVNGLSTHDKYHEFRVDVKQQSHPILEGVQSFVTNDELYFNLLMRPDMDVLMTGNQDRFGATVVEPLLCTHRIYNARCVYFALGHDAKSVALPEYRKILVQSIEWAAGRR